MVPASLGQASLELEIAANNADRHQGLSDRASMPTNRGMLFLLDGRYQVIMVMRRMHFPLDFIWLKDGRVMGITPNVPNPAQGETPRRAVAPDKVDGVIEVNAGWSAQNHISTGDRLIMSKGFKP